MFKTLIKVNTLSKFSLQHFARFSSLVDAQKYKNQFKPVNRANFQHSKQLPDFYYPESNIVQKIELTDEMSKRKHPLEYAAEHLRNQENPYHKMNDSSLLLTNFPPNLDVTEDYLIQLVKKADQGALVKRITLSEALRGSTAETAGRRISYAIVEFEIPKFAETVRRGLRKHWIQDFLLKVKTQTDAKRETFNSRTIIATNLPSHFTPEDVIAVFSDFGAITHVELPSIDSVVQSQLREEQPDHFLRVSKQRKEEEYRLAQQLLKESEDFESQFKSVLTQSHGEETANEMIKNQDKADQKFTKFDMLDEERVQSFMRVMQQLQLEGIQVKNSKSTLKSLLASSSVLNSDVNAQIITQENSVEHHQRELESKKTQIQGTLKYLLSNSESLDNQQAKFMKLFQQDTTQLSDPMHKLQRMSMSELTRAYDQLLNILEQRELHIQSRIEESLRVYGKDEKVLFESLDYRRENEQLPDVFRNLLSHDLKNIDQILGVNEQVNNIKAYYTIPPQVKLYMWLTDQAPFAMRRNFNESQLAYANTEKFDQYRIHQLHDSNVTRSQARSVGKTPSPFQADQMEQIEQEYQRASADANTPFDEIYHKERKLIFDIIKAEKTLKRIEENLPNPAGHSLFDPSKIESDSKYGNLFEDFEPQYLRDKRINKRINDRKNLSSIAGESSDHSYNQRYAQTIEDMITTGQINKEDFEAAKKMHMNNRLSILGYAFITFSHADEAQKAVIKTDGEMIIDKSFVEVIAKNDNIDHSEMDRSYFMRKMSNEGKLVEERTKLRETKKELRQFERNIDQEIPTLKRLADFKSMAQEIIENRKHATRRDPSQRRTKRETEELYEKLKQYQIQNPQVDLSSLYETYEADRARLNQHKRSLQSFKEFEFLKAGISKDKKPLNQENKTRESSLYEPFNYPGLENSVARVFVDGIQPKIGDPGELNAYSSSMQRKGRRFSNYTEQEFLEAYLGKDYARKADLEQDPYNQLFNFGESYKEMFPDPNEFLEYPELKEKQQKLKEFIGLHYADGNPKDKKFFNFMNSVDQAQFMEDMLPYQPHPTDPNRDMLSDYNKAFQQLAFLMQKRGSNKLYDEEVNEVLGKLKNEYYYQPKAADQQFMKDLASKKEDEIEEYVEQVIKEQEQAEEKIIAENNQFLEQFKAQFWNDEKQKLISKLDSLIQNPSISQNVDDLIKLRDKMKSGDWDQEKTLEEWQQLSDEEFGFEKKSKFEPMMSDDNTNKDQKGTKGQGSKPQKQVRQKQQQFNDGKQKKTQVQEVPEQSLEFEMFSSEFEGAQSGLRERETNENLYNLETMIKDKTLNLTDPELIKYQEMADKLTAFRKAKFEEMKAAEYAKPTKDRVPHLFGSNGLPRPYSKQELEGLRKQAIDNMPTSDEETDAKYQEDIADQRLKRSKNLIEDIRLLEQIEANKKKVKAGEKPDLLKLNDRENPDLPIIDIFKFEADEIVPSVTIAELLKTYKKTTSVNLSFGSNSAMRNYAEAQMDETDLAQHKFRSGVENGPDRTLSDFVGQDTSSQIYKEYRDQKDTGTRDKSIADKKQAEQMQKVLDKASEQMLKQPTFEQFFKNEAQRKSQFAQYEGVEHEEREQELEEQRIKEDELDESQYRRELIARMFGGKLTARQYGVLMRQSADDDEKEVLRKAMEHKNRLVAKDHIRNSEEIIESYRRKKVLDGEWTEADSYQLMQNHIDALMEKTPTETQYKINRREAKKNLKEELKGGRISGLKNEREYYFDEGLGESLNQHVQKLKAEMPNVDIQTRRDQDGLPIVKINFTPKFKYDLDQVLNADPAQMHALELETQEEILKQIGNEGIKKLLNSKNGVRPDDALTVAQADEMQSLMNQRFFGIYKNDLPGFMLKFMAILNSPKQGPLAVVESPTVVRNPFSAEGKTAMSDQVFSQLKRDKATLEYELQYQLMLKINDKKIAQKRDHSDFVKLGSNENLLYRQQVDNLSSTIRILEQDNEWLLKAGESQQQADQGEDLDMQKYRDLKAEIKRRKDAKERIINQGFPELKPFARY